jgi:FkbM family methyltransferase
MKSAARVARSVLLAVARAEARTLRLRGTDRALRLLYHPDRRRNDYLAFVGAYGDSLIQIDTRSFIEWWLYMYGGYEPGGVNLMKRLAYPGSVFFDVGANIGIYTLQLARAVGQTGAVHAFEPHPRYRRRLIENVALNNLRNVVVADTALGAHPGQATLYAATRSGQGIASLHTRDEAEETFTCNVTTIDDYVASSSLPGVDLIKIDTEGSELSVLEGARGTLERCKPCVRLEISEHLALPGVTPANVAEFLYGIGYQIWRLLRVDDPNPRLVRVTTPESHDGSARPFRPEDWLAIHPDMMTESTPPVSSP